MQTSSEYNNNDSTTAIVPYINGRYNTSVSSSASWFGLTCDRKSTAASGTRQQMPMINVTRPHDNDNEHFLFILRGLVVPMLFILITLIGVIGNMLVIYVIVTRERMRTLTNLLLLNLAVGDLAFVGFVPPVTAYQFAMTNWPFGDVVCRLMHFVTNVTAYVTIYTLVLVAVVRYMTVVHGAKTARIRTNRNVLIAIVVLWIGMMVANTPVLHVYGLRVRRFRRPVVHTINECMHLDEDRARFVVLTFFVFAYLLPLGMIATFSSFVVCYINRHQSAFVNQTAARSQEKKKKAGRLLLLVVVMFAIFWLPIHIQLIVAYFSCPKPLSRWTEVLRVVWHCLMYTNSAINPFIYHHASNDFRNGFHDVVRQMRCSNAEPTSDRNAPSHRRHTRPRSVREVDDARNYVTESRDAVSMKDDVRSTHVTVGCGSAVDDEQGLNCCLTDTAV